ncbi:MAG: LLM class F420-dependent oxidoreductase [Myxococcales bacterium]|nr:LLM class F420-dependent oxidoreductase [Myxococcales bacterium]MCZ6714205.1 LLM class F420-dependent oxidoreductase [Deltaproteobacteria bacterium]MCZ6821358.1 LLM class F420-dependent oxidoreductase [Deltaproteobacteria bacterium]TDJ02886.1 MAG: LLM class F420-dependent oxidoreductase [Deltaproteobacteria bacterium]TDJ06750.1 MAG: LLM class F420-dependent oxidoreductase [Deltaproteobacteria bacterium]
MKLGLALGYWGSQPANPLEVVLQAERLGYETAWFAEAYGSDVFSPLCWFGSQTSRIKLGTAVMQISARTPACTAMTMATIDHLCQGRLVLGIGVSGPQVVEGWYGQPFPKPLARTREYVEIVRKILRRDAPVENPGPHYPLPYPGGTGLGKPLKLIVHPLRRHIPIYLGAEGPKNVAMATEIADGWLPIFVSPYRFGIYDESLRGMKEGFEIATVVPVNLSDDVAQALMPIKANLGFYIGGMGAPSENFHLNLIVRMGFEEPARKVQELFLAGKRAEAISAVPDELADEISLVGPRERIRERLAAWRETPVTQIIVGSQDPAVLRLLAEELL